MCHSDGTRAVYRRPLQCHPQPDLLNPCEDALGGRGEVSAVSWVIGLVAVAGNAAVVLVTVVTWCRSNDHCSFSVSKYLILHLAISDLGTGLYVLLLSAVSTATSGRYYQFGVVWQTRGGCDAAGFLALLSLQVSVFTLSVISAERW